MEHRAKKDGDGHFWGCFPCKKYLDSDAFGAVLKLRAKAGRKPKVSA
jgi:hypothetical protein